MNRRFTPPGFPTGSSPQPPRSPHEEDAAQAAREHERAGDLRVYRGDLPAAKRAYGDAIDGYLQGRCFEAAAEVCRKLIRIAPQVTRTHYTLAFLLVGDGRHAEAAEALKAYAHAVAATGTQAYAIPRLVLLSHAVDDPALLESVAARLRELGATHEGDRILHRPPEHAAPPDHPRRRWERLLPIVLRS